MGSRSAYYWLSRWEPVYLLVAVLEKVIHALEARKPRLRYPVTFPSHLFTWLRRLLTGRALDQVLVRVSNSGQR